MFKFIINIIFTSMVLFSIMLLVIPGFAIIYGVLKKLIAV